jgi:2-hydroxyglutarate dehydrogenase
LFQGLKAIHSPHTGIIDYGEVTRSYGRTFEKAGGKVYTNFEKRLGDCLKDR